MATAQVDQTIMVEQGVDLSMISSLTPQTGSSPSDVNTPNGTSQSMAGPSGVVESIRANEVAFPWSAEGRLYAGFAQHFLLTYFPVAYPRWYLEGFGEIFSTLSADQDGVIEYGRAPAGLRQVIEKYGQYRLTNLLNGQYLQEKQKGPDWTPYHAWALTHLMFFGEEWKEPLHRYLAAVASGASPEKAAAALGDLKQLQAAFASYRGSKIPFERMTYPPERAVEPVVRRLQKSEAAFVQGRLELGARVDEPGRDRDGWLTELREDAARYPTEPRAQLLLAEAECRTGNDAACLAAADRTLALEPENAAALAWKGIATAHLAAAGPAEGRAAGIKQGRALIVRANRIDTEAVQPLIAYFRSFADVGEAPTDAALDGLAKASESVPSAPSTRLLLGRELVRRGDKQAAQRVLRPVTDGAYNSPEKPQAEAALSGRRN